ncbi:MAG: hypothetical protein EHM43_06110, partial [Ignavibacteriae bacterium]
MNEQIKLLAHLAAIDARLDDLHDELGDLPAEVKKLEQNVRTRMLAAEEMQARVKEVEHLQGTGHVTIQEMQDKETKLTEQQFKVKNNR